MFETALPCGERRLGGVETVWHGGKGGQTCVKRCSGESGAQTWPLTDSEPHSWGFIPLTLLKYTTVYYTELYFRGHMALWRLLRNTAWGSHIQRVYFLFGHSDVKRDLKKLPQQMQKENGKLALLHTHKKWKLFAKRPNILAMHNEIILHKTRERNHELN